MGNCNIETGKAYRRSQKDLYDMCEFFGKQCQQRGLTHSVRQDFYNHDINTSPDKKKRSAPNESQRQGNFQRRASESHSNRACRPE